MPGTSLLTSHGLSHLIFVATVRGGIIVSSPIIQIRKWIQRGQIISHGVRQFFLSSQHPKLIKNNKTPNHYPTSSNVANRIPETIKTIRN